jgi:hypothetical protein
MASITAVDTVPTPRNPIFIVDSLALKEKTPDKRGSSFARRIGEPSLAGASSSQIRLPHK